MVTAAQDAARVRATLVAWMVAGVQTQYEHLRTALPEWAVDAGAIEVVPYLPRRWIERLPLPSSMRGTLRSTHTALTLFRGPAVDVVWSQVALPLIPFALTLAAWRQTSIVYAIDCTPQLLWQFHGSYPGVTDPSTPKGRLTAALLRLFLRHCAAVLPWSEWAARSMTRDYGVAPDRVQVVPPGIDVRRWSPRARAERERTQLLFVGGDFDRKGGPLLLDLYRRHLRDECDLHLVTRARLPDEAGVRLYQDFQPDDSRLLELYRRCDILVLPTRADCYSMAAIEAMACGLPVVISRVGGIAEIVVDGQTGLLVPPGDPAACLQAVQTLVRDPWRRRRYGDTARTVAVQRFDAVKQSGRVADLMRSVAHA